MYFTGSRQGLLSIFCVIGFASISAAANAAGAFAPVGDLHVARTRAPSILLQTGKVLVLAGASDGDVLASAELYDSTTRTFATTGSLATPRQYTTATVLADGRVLVAGGQGFAGSPFLASAEIYDPATGVFSATGSLASARGTPTATLLVDGRVLVSGGYNGVYVAGAELFDPASNTFTPAGDPATRRYGATATRLQDGRVLIAGGQPDDSHPEWGRQTELYDPNSGSFSAGGMLAVQRNHTTASLLADGRVLIAGGCRQDFSGAIASAEIYDPATNAFAGTGSLAGARCGSTATLLNDGRVLVTGGYADGFYLDSSEIYDPATASFSAAPTLGDARADASATRLADGRVLVSGGDASGGVLVSAELYEPDGSASNGGNLIVARHDATATLLGDGRVLIAGGGSASAELYDPVTATSSLTGSLVLSLQQATATLLPTGKVLIGGGQSSGGNHLADAELYDPASGTFAATGSKGTARLEATATLLADGRVLVAGGYANGSYTATAELYDSATGVFTATGSMGAARFGATATLLGDGRVLVAGGYNGSYLATAEIYDPTSGTFSPAASLATPRRRATATLIEGGRVLIAGGGNRDALAVSSAELYDPAHNSFSSTGALSTARQSASATRLPDGRVLIAGGEGLDGALASVERYDPAVGQFVATTPLSAARYEATATLLADGRVLIAGGRGDNGDLTSTELYDPAAPNFTASAALAAPRSRSTIVALADGGALLVGGNASDADGSTAYLASAERYDPASAAFVATGSLAIARENATATLLGDDRVLVVGGFGQNGAVAAAELYDPLAATFSTAATLAVPRNQATATLLADGRVLVAGGDDGNGHATATAEVYDPATATFTATGNLAQGRSEATATLLADGRVLIAGGRAGSTFLTSVELYDPSTGTFSATGPLQTQRALADAVLLADGSVLVIAGDNADGVLSSVERYDPSAGTFSPTGALISARTTATATLLADGRVVVAGGLTQTIRPIADAELYDPATGTWIAAGRLATARASASAVRLADGSVLIAGGGDRSSALASSERFDIGLGYAAAQRPLLSDTPVSLALPAALEFSGRGLRASTQGVSGAVIGSEASSGGTANSSTNVPLVKFERVDNGLSLFVASDPARPWTDTQFASSPLPAFDPASGDGLPLGVYRVTAFVNAIPSVARFVTIGPAQAAPDLTISKSHQGNFHQGQQGAQYTIEVSNVGVGVTFGEVTVADTLPAGMSLAAIAGDGWTCVGASATCKRSDALAAGAVYPPIILSVDIDTQTPPGSLVNFATVSGGGNVALGNDSASDPTVIEGVAASIAVVSGTPQSTAIDSAFAAPLVVRVTDVGGNALAGATVHFSAPASGASALLGGTQASTLDVITASDGTASVAAAANGVVGSYAVAANVDGVAGSGGFFLTNAPGGAAAIETVSGTPQSAAVGTPFAQALGVEVTDAGGNPVAGVTVNFSVPISGASATLSASSAVTGANGRASVTATANQVAGSYQVTATAIGVAAPASFALTNTTVATPLLTIAIDDGVVYARYGQLLDYMVTLGNSGDAAAEQVTVSSVLPDALDAATATWMCLDAATGHCTANGEGALADSNVTVPAGGSVRYVLTAALRVDADGDPFTTEVSTTGDGQTVTAQDTDVPVIFRDGFDDTAAAAADQSIAEAERWRVDVPATRATLTQINPLIELRVSDRNAFRIERLDTPASAWARLVEHGAGMAEFAHAWRPVAVGPLSFVIDATADTAKPAAASDRRVIAIVFDGFTVDFDTALAVPTSPTRIRALGDSVATPLRHSNDRTSP